MAHDQPDQQRRSSLAVWLTVATMLLPPIYVLSAGPAVWLVAHGYMPEDWLGAMCQPLEWLATIPGFVAFFDWYVELWGG